MTKPTEAQEREAFECEMTKLFGEGEDFSRDAEDCYVNRSWRDAWIGWKAGRASLQQPAQAGVAQQDGAQEPVAYEWRHICNKTGRLIDKGLSFIEVFPTNDTFWNGEVRTEVAPLLYHPSPQSATDAQVMSAVANLIKVKGRHHTEQAYRLLVAAYDAAIQAEADKGKL